MHVLIVEDEALIRQRLLRMAGEIAGERARFDAVATLDEAEERLRRRAYDAVMLDLSLEGDDGFELLRRAVAGAAHTIVVSAHTDRAMEAFALGVIDFVPKPFTRERLALALDRLWHRRANRASEMRWLAVWRVRGTALVSLTDILYARADGEGAELALADGRREISDKSLERLCDSLPETFVRCHRGFVVNLAHVERFESLRASRYRLWLKNGAWLPVGRTHLASVKARLGS